MPKMLQPTLVTRVAELFVSTLIRHNLGHPESDERIQTDYACDGDPIAYGHRTRELAVRLGAGMHEVSRPLHALATEHRFVIVPGTDSTRRRLGAGDPVPGDGDIRTTRLNRRVLAARLAPRLETSNTWKSFHLTMLLDPHK